MNDPRAIGRRACRVARLGLPVPIPAIVDGYLDVPAASVRAAGDQSPASSGATPDDATRPFPLRVTARRATSNST
jgi:hypothetical protein